MAILPTLLEFSLYSKNRAANTTLFYQVFRLIQISRCKKNFRRAQAQANDQAFSISIGSFEVKPHLSRNNPNTLKRAKEKNDVRVGADVFAKCRRCGEVWHVVVAVVPNRKTRVECKQCGGRHGYSPPAENAEANGGRKSSPAGPRGGRKRREPVIASDPSLPVRRYSQSDQYTTGDRILHPNFGEGVVQSISGPKKIRILFASGERTLAQRQKA